MYCAETPGEAISCWVSPRSSRTRRRRSPIVSAAATDGEVCLPIALFARTRVVPEARKPYFWRISSREGVNSDGVSFQGGAFDHGALLCCGLSGRLGLGSLTD